MAREDLRLPMRDAERLYLSEKTIKTHVGRILQKLAARDRVQAVIAA